MGKPNLGSTPVAGADRHVTSAVYLSLVAGLLYLTGLAFRPWIFPNVLGVPAYTTARELAENACPYTLANLLLRLPTLAIVLALIVRRGGLSGDLAHVTMRSVTAAITWTVVLSLALNTLGWWIFSWRLYTGTAAYAHALQISDQWASLGIWAVTNALIGPLIEEVVFRYGVLRGVLQISGSPRLAVVISSAVFSLAHLLLTPIRGPDLVNAAWLFAASIVLATIALRGRGGLCLCVVAHSTRNAAEIVTLFVALNVPPGR